ncbi:hypothetical protein D9C73_012933 [Collichthys lucidus]|uniref:Uncharacterized protein n=1 Tax=Collichthys lucidus TaxID=240159 RepID=A0A4U5UUA5_COLLU|nr:hypothetical protein D9C73_012933 [Collichthys lucidus]
MGEELERCQLKCDTLKKENKDLTSQCSQLAEDNQDNAAYFPLLVYSTFLSSVTENENLTQEKVEDCIKTTNIVQEERFQELQVLLNKYMELTGKGKALSETDTPNITLNEMKERFGHSAGESAGDPGERYHQRNSSNLNVSTEGAQTLQTTTLNQPATKAQRSVIEEHLQAKGSRHNTPNSLCWGRGTESDREN